MGTNGPHGASTEGEHDETTNRPISLEEERGAHEQQQANRRAAEALPGSERDAREAEEARKPGGHKGPAPEIFLPPKPLRDLGAMKFASRNRLGEPPGAAVGRQEAT